VSWGGGFSEGRSGPSGKNPTNGAVLALLAGAANTDLTLEVLDARGTVLRTFRSRLDSAGVADSVRADSARKARGPEAPGAGVGTVIEEAPDFEELARRGPRPARVPSKAGLNSFAWDLRHPDAMRFENMILWAGSTTGPLVAPGTYTCGSPRRGRRRDADRARARRPALEGHRGRLGGAGGARPAHPRPAVRGQRRRAHRAQACAGSSASGSPACRPPSARRTRRSARRSSPPSPPRGAHLPGAQPELADPLNYPIRLNNKLATLAGVVASADGRPTRQAYAVFDSLSRQLQVQLDAMQAGLGAQLPPVNAALARLGLPPVVPSTAEPPRRR
jgi:hypothetical protein